jgi:hypothetical protein
MFIQRMSGGQEGHVKLKNYYSFANKLFTVIFAPTFLNRLNNKA